MNDPTPPPAGIALRREEAIRHRLAHDFPLAIISLIGICGVAGILPFALYRFARGDLGLALLEAGIVAGIAGSVAYAWISGRTRAAAWIDVLLTSAGCVVLAYALGAAGLRWAYVLLVANFLLLRPREAVAVNAVVLAVLAFNGAAYPTPFDRIAFLVTASLVAVAAYVFAHRAHRHRIELEALAASDPLTGAGNRRTMEAELRMAVESAARDGRAWSLALLDLDHFKRVNDRHGHAAGDRVLLDLVDVVGEATRSTDRLFRFGGEEFVLLLPGAEGAALEPMLDALRLRIGDALRAGEDAVSVSIGAATLDAGEDWEAWLARADAALYRAKQAGRDRVVVDGAQAEAVAARAR